MSLANSKSFRILVKNEILDNTNRQRINVNLQRNNWMVVADDDRNFDPGSILKEKYQVKSAGNHLYEIGLSLYRLGEKKPQRLHNPYSSLIIFSVIILQKIISLAVSSTCAHCYLYLADSAHVLDIEFHFNPAMIMFLLMGMFCIALNIRDYYRGHEPDYLNLFGIYSGKCSPQSMGLTDKRYILKTARLLKYGTKALHIYSFYCLFLAIGLTFVPLISVCNWYELVLFAIPWSVITTLGLFLSVKIFFFNLFYHIITCYYLKTKLIHLNIEIQNRTKFKNRRFPAILLLVKKMDIVYDEIDSYNRSYWCKISLLFISLFSALATLWTYLLVYSPLTFTLKLLFGYFVIIVVLLFIFYLRTNAMIFTEGFKAYKLLNSLYLGYQKFCFPFYLGLKISIFIERIGRMNIGFYCGDLFLINDYAIYQIIITSITYFLKVAEISVLNRWLIEWHNWSNITTDDGIVKYLLDQSA